MTLANSDGGRGQPPTSLTALVDAQLDPPPELDLDRVRSFRLLQRASGDDESSLLSFLSSLFWLTAQELLRPNLATRQEPAFAKSWNLRAIAPNLPPVSTVSDTILVGRGGPAQHDMLILDPSYYGPVISAYIDRQAARALAEEIPYRIFARDRRRDFARRLREIFPRQSLAKSRSLLSEALAELSAIRDYGVVLAHRPELIESSCISPAIAIETTLRRISTVGLVVRDPRSQELLVSAANHAICESGKVTVAGIPATVVDREPLTDSCILKLPGGTRSFAEIAAAVRARGVLVRSPRSPAPATFDGVSSRLTRTVVRGHDPSVALDIPYFATKLYTDCDTNEGDSGAALFDEDGKIMGFAAFRTAYGDDPAYSVWIWARQVVTRHHLNDLVT